MSLGKNAKNLLSFLVRIGLSGALLWYVFSRIDTKQTMEVLKSAEIGYILIAAGIFIVINGILLVRWFVFIKALDLSLPFGNVVRHYFYGLFGNLFLPTAIGGDLIKVIGLCKDSSEKPKIVASVLIDRLSGFVSIAIVSAVAFLFGRGLIGDDTLLIPIVVMAAGVTTVLAVLFNERIYSFGCRLFTWFPRLKDGLMKMHYDIALLKGAHKYKEGIKGIVLASLSQTIFALTFYFTALGLHQNVPVLPFFVFVPMICIAAAVPSIGGLGVREVGAAYLLGKIGIEYGVAVSISLINFLFMVMVGLVGGLIYVYTLFAGRVQCDSPDAVGAKAGNA